MVTDDFNPYHEWLGLDSQLKQPNYYQLLGVEQNEANMMQISAAADRAAARVRSVRPGPHAAEWAKVLDEIMSAKNCLSDPNRRAQYDWQLAAIQPGAAGGYHRPAPRDKTPTPLPTAAQPNAYPTGAPMSAPTAAPIPPGTPHSIQQTPGTPAMPTPGAAPLGGAPMSAPRAYPTGSPQPLPSSPLQAAPVAGGVAPMPGTAAPIGAAPVTGQYGTAAATNPIATNLPTGVPLGATSPAAATTAASAGPGVKTGSERTASRMVRKRADRSKTVPLLAAGLGGAILILAVVLLAVIGGRNNHTKNGAARKHLPPNRPATRRPIATPRPSARSAKSSRHRPLVSSYVTETRKEPKPGDVSKPPLAPTEASPKPKTDLPPVIDPQPKTTPPPTVQPQPAEVAALATALKSARAKLEESDFDGALAELKKGESLPKLPEHQAKYERLRLLTEYASRFRSALMAAIKHLEAGDEISAGANAAAAVVGVTADRITLKIDGRNRSYPISDLSPGLAVAIADTWLDQNDPVCLVAKAAYLASLKDARDDRLAKAREWFQEASSSGVDIGDLGKVIDDKYDELEKDLAP